MTEKNDGAANAGDAQVMTVDDVDSLAQVSDQEDPRPAAEAAVTAAEKKVEKQKAHLAGAEESLKAAQAALADLK